MSKYITTEKTIWCSVCAEWDQMGAGGHVRHWRKAGWTLRLGEGWICPACSAKSREADVSRK